jgi:hypothetical protein
MSSAATCGNPLVPGPDWDDQGMLIVGCAGANKIEIDPKAGVLKSSLPTGTERKIPRVIAFGHWNHAWQGAYLLQLGSAPVQVASAKTAT